MSAQIIMAAVKVVGVVMSAKSMLDGIKEGDWLQAVVGGVGAYYGATSLASGLAPADAATEGIKDVATETVKDVATDNSAGLLEQGLKFDPSTTLKDSLPSADAFQQSVDVGLDPMATIDKAGTDALSLTPEAPRRAMNVLDTPAHMQAAPEPEGLLSKFGKHTKTATDWMDKHPNATYAGLQLAGGMMQGKAAEKQEDERRREYQRSRNRRGNVPTNQPRAVRNPRTGRMEIVQ